MMVTQIKKDCNLILIFQLELHINTFNTNYFCFPYKYNFFLSNPNFKICELIFVVKAFYLVFDKKQNEV